LQYPILYTSLPTDASRSNRHRFRRRPTSSSVTTLARPSSPRSRSISSTTRRGRRWTLSSVFTGELSSFSLDEASRNAMVGESPARAISYPMYIISYRRLTMQPSPCCKTCYAVPGDNPGPSNLTLIHRPRQTLWWVSPAGAISYNT
jgi:hypothetical protein